MAKLTLFSVAWFIVVVPVAFRVLHFFVLEVPVGCVAAPPSKVWSLVFMNATISIFSIFLAYQFAGLLRLSKAASLLSAGCILTGFVASAMGFAGVYLITGLVSDDIVYRSDFLYFSVTTLTTLGYGDIQPCPSARLVTSVQALLGFLLFPIVVVTVLRLTDFASKGLDHPDDSP